MLRIEQAEFFNGRGQGTGNGFEQPFIILIKEIDLMAFGIDDANDLLPHFYRNT